MVMAEQRNSLFIIQAYLKHIRCPMMALLNRLVQRNRYCPLNRYDPPPSRRHWAMCASESFVSNKSVCKYRQLTAAHAYARSAQSLFAHWPQRKDTHSTGRKLISIALGMYGRDHSFDPLLADLVCLLWRLVAALIAHHTCTRGT